MMHIVTDGVIAFLAAVGLAGLVWLTADWLVRRREVPLRAAIVLPVRGAAEELDYAVYTACRVRRRLGRYTPVLVVDCGLEEKSRLRAELLAENNNCVAVILPSQIEETMNKR